MTSSTTEHFRRAFAVLPERIQRRARQAYRQFQDDPSHPSLCFKQVHSTRPIYSARVGLGYRALAVRVAQALRDEGIAPVTCAGATITFPGRFASEGLLEYHLHPLQAVRRVRLDFSSTSGEVRVTAQIELALVPLRSLVLPLLLPLPLLAVGQLGAAAALFGGALVVTAASRLAVTRARLPRFLRRLILSEIGVLERRAASPLPPESADGAG